MNFIKDLNAKIDKLQKKKSLALEKMEQITKEIDCCDAELKPLLEAKKKIDKLEAEFYSATDNGAAK